MTKSTFNLEMLYSTYLAASIAVLPVMSVTYIPGLDAMQSMLPLLIAHLRACKDAAMKSRLDSETYKRLNLALTLFALLSVVGYQYSPTSLAQWRIGGLSRPDLTIADILRSPFGGYTGIIGAFAGWQGWRKGIASGGKSMIAELKEGFASLPGMLFKPKNIVGASYSVLLGLQLLLFSININIVASFMPTPLSTLSAVLYAAAPEVLVASSLVTLLDAANRNRLNATTFRHLNMGLFLTSALSAYRCIRGIHLDTPLALFRATVHVATAGLALSSYIKAKVVNGRNQKLAKQHFQQQQQQQQAGGATAQ